MKYLALCALILLCACTVSPQNRVDLTIRNKSMKTVRLRASTLGFAQSVVLRPGEAWTGWWDRRFIGATATFDIEEEALARE